MVIQRQWLDRTSLIGGYLTILISATLPLSDALNTVFIGGLILSWMIGKKVNVRNREVLYLFLSILFVMSVSLLYSEDYSSGLFVLERSASLLIFPLVYGTGVIEQPHRTVRISQNVFLLSILIIIAFLEYSIISSIIENDQSFKKFFSIKNTHKNLAPRVGLNSTYLGMYINLSLVIIYSYFINKLYNRTLLTFIALVLFVFLFQLGSRMQLFIAYIIFITSLIMYPNSGRWKIIGGFLIINVVVISIFWESAIRYRFEQIFGYQYKTGYVDDSQHKLNLWSAGIEANSNILFGEGVGDAKQALLNSYLKNDMELEFRKQYNAHNQFIEIYVSNGLVGLTLFVLLFALLFHKFLKANNKVAFLFVIIILLSCMTESILLRRQGVVFFMFFVSLYTFLIPPLSE